MTINRHNYEEYFLLYVDNELCAVDRNAVEVFVQQNPDLAEELKMLQQTVMGQDDIVFSDKAGLLKETGFAGMQEKLLLLADGELSIEDRQQVLASIAGDKNIAAEWDILQHTKLQADAAIVFPDKRSLYRTERTRVIGIRWWRAVAAVLLLGFSIWGGVSVYRNNIKPPEGGGIVKHGNNDGGQPQKNTPVQSNNNGDNNPFVNAPVKTNGAPANLTASDIPQHELPQPGQKGSTVPGKINRQNSAAQKDNIALTKDVDQVKKPGNNLPKPVDPVLENINKDERNKTSTAAVTPNIKEAVTNNLPKINAGMNKTEKANETVKTTVDLNTSTLTNSFAQAAVYNGNAEEKNNDRVLYMDEDKVKRTKIGGIFRKLKRVIERNTNIKTGDGIKVAGFEIAIK